MGLGVFVKEIERQLQEGQLDMAVHSLKDLPTRMAPDLAVGAVLRREDPRRRAGQPLGLHRWTDLPEGAQDRDQQPPRRQALLKYYCPQVTPVALRGNVETRLRKARGRGMRRRCIGGRRVVADWG